MLERRKLLTVSSAMRAAISGGKPMAPQAIAGKARLRMLWETANCKQFW